VERVDKEFTITFTGNIGVAQGLNILPVVAKILKDKEISLKFKIVGDGRYKDEFVAEIERRNVQEMFELTGRKAPEEIPEILAKSDAAFLSFMDNPLFANTIPAKLQSYMACGVPIIASATGESKRIIEEAECGVCCEIGNANKLAETIVDFVKKDKSKLDEMRVRAERYSAQHFNKKMLMDYMDRYFVEGKEA
jgi:glycosyltransferase involved in cell wall biosynthesis